MWDLRWVLLGLGALLVAGVYLWTKGLGGRRLFPDTSRRVRAEPSIGETPPAAAAVGASSSPDAGVAPEPPPRKPAPVAPDRVITLRLIPRGDDELPTERAVVALTGAGLKHGRYGIFHKEDVDGEPAFSVASLTEPGTFDLAKLHETTIAGLSFFVVLPGTGDPVARFDAMVETARALSVELAADLHDERGSSWSVQRERYLREEIIEYRLQAERH
jgi:cell division protein ZipA